jgi:deazaflavin-dependent oxidoreductase (nitroreductase family)
VPNIRWLLSLITRLHRFAYLATDGWIGSRTISMRFLVLFHLGRKTGLERITPLLCIVEDTRWIVIGSNAGDDRPPAWWLNLQHKPEVQVQYRRERVDVQAREVEDSEYDALWAKLQSAYPYYDNYRQRTDRKIPIVVLDRSPAAA